ncbi:hypothetical protein LTR91_025964 [Friedmanniomyces endolithicus]|uniref:Uncharacterized protein n=1 Tax=Friedmanniomyces endolithicus TaxID=329885 RepID=A0AAN6K2I6_9PEZI|nr:hypothetical protein LTR57_007886 [Friedmanniomyces endolithicus]KAK0950048.1 hypothetical protein LTR91_025964 [Friedmanniomyces endolithicus]KAK0970345.1 hypothetical protein LTS01_015853 [Friedmanniomyces endolithicus]KAK1033476.1 hypothetical protein LTS16_016250 [Friedmanniomyces endolithicus]
MKGRSPVSSYRLTRSRTNDTTSSTSSRSPDPTKTSYDGLRQPEARQLLREQLSDAFQDGPMKASVPLKERFTRRSSTLDIATSLSAKSSSSTVNSVGPHRASAVSEDSQGIDLERAIQLLQELKKTASPDELVALHRALLPTKEVEVVKSPRAFSFDERPTSTALTAYQRRANLPPGLATRGGVAEDLLRKQGESSTPKKPSAGGRQTQWLQHSVSTHGTTDTPTTHAPAKSISSIAALDLADDNANPIGAHASTPLESPWSHTGNYRSGTLHITNGAASPEPSLRSVYGAMRTETAEPKQKDGYFASSGGRASIDLIEARASMDVLPRRMSAESLPIRDRILSSSKAQQQRKDRANRLSGMSTSSKESLVSQPIAPLHIGTKLSRPVSPVSEVATPRFQQRWSHRASQISAEYMSECELTASPYEEKNAVLNFATRLSTVFDSDGDDEEDGTPAAALSRLTGDPEVLADHAANVALSMNAIEGEPSTTRFARIHRPPPQKSDSGYASDHALGSMTRIPSREPRRASHEAGATGKTPFLAAPRLHELQESDEQTDMADVKSLYTLEEILKAAQAPSDVPTSPQTAKSKKSLSLLRLHTLKADKRSSMPALASTVASGSSDSVPTIASAQGSATDADKAQQTLKQQSKLQKAMPASLKKQRKEEMRRIKSAQMTHEVPAVPDEVVGRHAQRLSLEPFGAMSLDPFTTPVDQVPALPELEHARTEPDPTLAPEVFLPITVPSAAPGPAETVEQVPRNRSKSLGRGRRKSIDGNESSPETNRSWVSKLRSKSASRTRAQTPKRSSLDVLVRKSRPSTGDSEAVSPGDENVPAWTDFSSVAQSLGSGSYDIATNQTMRASAPAAGATLHQLQSPYMISTGLNKARATKGMNSQAASELARLKSRDFAEKEDKEPSRDRPRIAFPKRGKSSNKNGPYCPNVSVEDRFPSWQGKTSLRDASPQRPQLAHRPHSMYAESIPPMPELPADAAVKAIKADVMVAKKLKDSAGSSPAASARNSQDAQQQAEKGVMTKVTTTTWHANTTHGNTAMETQHITEQIASKPAAVLHVQVRELAGSGSEQSSMVEAHEEEQSQSPSHESQHPGWPSWEQQAKAWRQRRESLGAALGRPIDEASVITADSPPVSRKVSAATLLQPEPAVSPSIVVSRYITPLGAENAARANMRPRLTDSAVQRANVYRDLIVEDNKENRPAQQDVPRTDSAVTTRSTTSTFVTVKSWDPRPGKPDVPRINSAFSTDSRGTVTTTSSSTVSRNQGRTASGNYIPYSPVPASVAQRSRDQSLARLNGEGGANGTSTLPANTRKGAGGVYPSSNTNNNTANKNLNSSTDSLGDRYSGGLQYGWDRTAGFSGSAGTRHSGGNEIRRKSVRMSESFGLDLSDVPVFLQRMG